MNGRKHRRTRFSTVSFSADHAVEEGKQILKPGLHRIHMKTKNSEDYVCSMMVNRDHTVELFGFKLHISE